MSKDLDKLRRLFVGRTVVGIEPPNAPESFAIFVLDDGTIFRLHATDLGYWTEPTTLPGVKYRSLAPMFLDYYNHTRADSSYNDLGEPILPEVVVDNLSKEGVVSRVLRITAPDGETFEGDVGKFPEWDQAVVNSPVGLSLIAYAAFQGDSWHSWKLVFTPGINSWKMDMPVTCPEELYLPEEP